MKYFLLSIFLISLSCNNTEKEKELNLREKNLSEREAAFAEKESEYLSLIKMRDSIFAKKDSAVAQKWPENIQGIWAAKTICTESNCNNYVVGDQRTDNWEFVNDSNQLLVRVISNNEIVRLYQANYANNTINLKYQTDSTATKPVSMQILLDNIGKDKMRGTRKVVVDNTCTAKFSIELVRLAK